MSSREKNNRSAWKWQVVDHNLSRRIVVTVIVFYVVLELLFNLYIVQIVEVVRPTTNVKLILLQLQFNTFTMWKGCEESLGPRALLIYYLFTLMRKSIMSSQSPVYQKASDCSSFFWQRMLNVFILIATMLENDLINIHYKQSGSIIVFVFINL